MREPSGALREAEAGGLSSHPYASESRVADALTAIARQNYGHAKANPNAQSRRWDIDGDHMQKRSAHLDPLLGGRTKYLECSQITDGAAAIILATPAWTAARGCREHSGRFQAGQRASGSSG